ncbi:MAG: proton-conducting transporter membrane subunit, partial [Nitrospiraceae bacterium]
MLELLWLVPALPLVGFVTLAVAGGWCSRRLLAVIGVGSVAGSMVVSGLVSLSFWQSVSSDHAYSQTLWTWMSVSTFTPAIGFYLDALSLVMMLVITVVSFLIHLYSVEMMIGDEGYRRFFAYMNLFVASMLTLVLADNLLLLYLGWEGVGLCSYLLIGYWYREPANGQAAQKAFIVTRLGDVALAIGFFLLFAHLDTLNIQDLMQRAVSQWPVGSGLAIAAAALLLGG